MIGARASRSSSASRTTTTNAIRLTAGEKVVIIGESGSGKTNLECALLLSVERFAVFDSKMHPNEWPAWAGRNGIIVTTNPDDIIANPRCVLQISEISLRDRNGWYKPGRPGHIWTRALRAVRAKGKGVVVFDEVIQTMPAGQTHPEAWQIYSQGAAFHISGWAGSQIVNRMETLVPRLAEHCFAARMVNREDQKILASTRGLDCSVLGSLPDYHFAYHKKPMTEWIICPPVPLVLPPRNPERVRESSASRDEASGHPEASQELEESSTG